MTKKALLRPCLSTTHVHIFDPNRGSRERLVALLRNDYAVSASELLDWRALLDEVHRWGLIIIDEAALDDARYAPLHNATRNSSLPVLITSTDQNEDDAIAALNAGAADYVRKPFSEREVSARVRAILRRNALIDACQAARFTVGGRVWSLDDQSRRLLDNTGHPVDLSAQEYNLLRTFLQSPNRVLSRDYLLQALGHVSSPKQLRSVDVWVFRLRVKLGETLAGHTDPIRTVRSEGYVFECGPLTKVGRNAEHLAKTAGLFMP